MGSMRKSQLSKAKQDRLIEHFVAGATARYADDLVRVNQKRRFIIFIDSAKSYLIILSKRLTRFSAKRSKLVKVTLVASEKESAADVQQKKFRSLAF